MTRWMCLILLLALASPVSGSGWHDYELPIDPNFRIVRANSMDVILVRSGGSVVYMPTDYPNVGPICGYVVTPTHILLKHHGRVPRNLFAGDTFEEVDASRTFYFTVNKGESLEDDVFHLTRGGETPDAGAGGPPDDPDSLNPFEYSFDGGSTGSAVRGPFDEEEFGALPEVRAAMPLRWVEPSNPNVVTPVVGTLYFLAISAWILGWPLLVLGAIALGGMMLWRRRRRIGRHRAS